jgi:hypothetical protein
MARRANALEHGLTSYDSYSCNAERARECESVTAGTDPYYKQPDAPVPGRAMWDEDFSDLLECFETLRCREEKT